MNRAVVFGTVLVTLIAGMALAMHHETDALIELDKEWGAAAQGQEAVDAINRVVSDGVLAISVNGLGSKKAMIEAAQAADAPAGPYKADNYEVKFLTDDVAVMVHHAGDPNPHWSLHVWQKKGDKWMVVASASAPEAEDESSEMNGTRTSGYRITIPAEADAKAFEEAMKTHVFPRSGVGQTTRGGTVTRQSLLRNGNEYTWLVHWISKGGTPFGSTGLRDPAPDLTEFGAETSPVGYEVVAEEGAG